MDIPYGYDCYAFSPNQIKHFESNVSRAGRLHLPPYLRFTRKNEDYTGEQIHALVRAGRLDGGEINAKMFCGIKIQIGIGIVSNFLKTGVQYRTPNKGRSELINGTWNGIVSGLTVDRQAENSYDIAFGNFLAYDEEFPYVKFGPFFAVESKLVMLTGSSRGIEASSFGTNIGREIWLTILLFMLLLSLLSSFRIHWQRVKYKSIELALRQLLYRHSTDEKGTGKLLGAEKRPSGPPTPSKTALVSMVQNFFFIYFTMLLNKPCVEFDDLVWPRRAGVLHKTPQCHLRQLNPALAKGNEALLKHYGELQRRRKRRLLPSSIRLLSYLWSAACFIMASIYSGEMLAVILLHTDQNIDSISQLIHSKPPIEPVIRQDDFTYNLMLKSLDANMLLLHNKTKIIPRPEVYTRRFIEAVSERKQALLGDDELIETIYDIYHKYFPLYRSKVSYLQYPISFMYRKDLNSSLEAKLRRGMVQMFEMGLVHRWYQAQKETYIHFYDSYEKKDQEKDLAPVTSNGKYRPLSMHHFESFFRSMVVFIAFAFLVLLLEILHSRLNQSANQTNDWR